MNENEPTCQPSGEMFKSLTNGNNGRKVKFIGGWWGGGTKLAATQIGTQALTHAVTRRKIIINKAVLQWDNWSSARLAAGPK